MKDSRKFDFLEKQLESRVLLLDGAFGTMVQQYGLQEKDFRGDSFENWPKELKGLNDLLVLTRPDVVSEIHRKYLDAGADIIETDSFNSNAISLKDYDMADKAYELSFAAARLARKLADDYTNKNPEKPRFVAGSVGPTNKTASMSADILDPGAREVDFDELKKAYADQINGLLDGGADIILIETIFDTLNAKAAIYALSEISEERGIRIPVMISATVSDASGRTLSGQTLEAFLASVDHADVISVGLNCGFGSRHLTPYLRTLSEKSRHRISVHPNAGLPDGMGHYDEDEKVFAKNIEGYLREGLVNIVGGCCGTTPSHISCVANFLNDYKPRKRPKANHVLTLSNLESLPVEKDKNFINIGERTNVAGSAKFARLIREENYEEALSVARAQVEAGGQVIDVCMDAPLINGVKAMTRFLNLVAAEPEISRVPIMIDSSNPDVLEAGLKTTQGKSIVNSISLKEGEEKFLSLASKIRQYGAAAVVMLFDENGQADTLERKIEVAKRSYDLLVDAGFPPEDIIFDPNIMAVATGISEHDVYAKAFIDATRWIKENLHYAKVSGGVSNLSFAFRGNNKVREAMHSVFLYHAIKAGMDMAIVNPQMLQIYSEIEPELLERVEDLILCRRDDASERLMEYAEELKGETEKKTEAVDSWRELPLKERIENSFMKGVTTHIGEDMEEALAWGETPMGVIDNLLMPVMTRIGEYFGAGKMFLPQVVKSARVMKAAIDVLAPHIEEMKRGDGNEDINGSGNIGKVVIATVKGDVHDIGKNIVSVVVGCNGYEVNDLGVMATAQKIADEAERTNADAILLSGLITPSLDEMTKVAEELERRGLKLPLIIGGATTSGLHTAVKIAPAYSGVVIHATDASSDGRILGELLSSRSEEYVSAIKDEQKRLRDDYQRSQELRSLVSIDEARRKANPKPQGGLNYRNLKGKPIEEWILIDYPIEEVKPFIDWTYFFNSWGLKGKYPEIFEDKKYGEEAKKLYDDALKALKEIVERKYLCLKGVVGFFPAYRHGDNIIVKKGEAEYPLPMLRSQKSDNGFISLADFFPEKEGYICLFALSGGFGLKEYVDSLKGKDEYRAILAKLLADRLTEAFAEQVHYRIRKEIFGTESPKVTTLGEKDIADILAERYEGRRIAIGYPAVPDHTLKKEIFDILSIEDKTGMGLTENYMIDPGEAVSGIILPEGDYFNIGHIGEDQLKDYSRRRGMSFEEMKKWLPNNI